VIDHLTDRVETTDSWAGIDALGVDTSLVSGTIGAYGTFWTTTTRRRRTKEAWYTFADGVLTRRATNGIDTAR
jgi:hypothetical protein